MENELISVIIPTYNRSHVIHLAIESVLSQTYDNFEIIIIDDNSNDNTQQIIQQYIERDGRIRYFRHSENKGGGFARNTGIIKSTGKYIAFLDSDDEWFPNKLEEQIKQFRNNEQLDVVFTSYNEMLFPSRKLLHRRIIKNKTPLKYLLCENFLGTTSSVMCTAKILKNVNGFNSVLKSAQDWDLYLRIIKPNNYYIIEQPLLNHMQPEKPDKYRISGNINNILSGLMYIVHFINEGIKLGEFGTISSRDKSKILCRLNYKISKAYYSMNDYRNSKQYLLTALKYNAFDLRCIRLLTKIFIDNKIK